MAFPLKNPTIAISITQYTSVVVRPQTGSVTVWNQGKALGITSCGQIKLFKTKHSIKNNGIKLEIKINMLFINNIKM